MNKHILDECLETFKHNRLTRVYGRLEGEVAALDVKGETVNLHPADADHHLVVPQYDSTTAYNCYIKIRRGIVLLCPVREQKSLTLQTEFHIAYCLLYHKT